MRKPDLVVAQCCVCGHVGEHNPESSVGWKDTKDLMRTCADGQFICRQCDGAIKRQSAFGKIESGMKKLRKFWEAELAGKVGAA